MNQFTMILLRSVKMADRQIHGFKALPKANYSPAIARAVEWLGDRYLLAKPINAAPKSRDHAAASSAFSDAQ